MWSDVVKNLTRVKQSMLFEVFWKGTNVRARILMPVFVLDIADNNGSEWHILAKQQLKHKPTTFA